MRTYDRGLDALGAAWRGGELFAGVRPWDNHEAYWTGDVVYFNEKYWRALRPVDPPLVPAIMSGEMPGDSDAWREAAQPSAEVLGARALRRGRELRRRARADVLGMFDMNAVERNLSALRPVTVDVARTLVRTGQDVIAKAIEGAKQSWYKSDLPGETERASVQAHLQWHADKLARYVGDKFAAYDSADDLKKYCRMAFVDGNAVEEGAAYLDAAWAAMWEEIQAKLQAMPRAAFNAALKGASWVTGVPVWALVVGGALTVGLVGYAGYRVATGPVGGAIARRYLP